MNEQLDHKIHSALDTCLSGVDNLPSQREIILHKATAHASSEHRLRRSILVALTVLLVLLGTAGAGTFTGMINWSGEPDESASPAPWSRSLNLSAAVTPASMRERIAQNFLNMEKDGAVRIIRYLDENGESYVRASSPSIEVQSHEEFASLMDGSDYILPTQAFWDTICDENYTVFLECRADSTYELIEQTTVYDDMDMFRYMPSEDSTFVYGLHISGWGGLDGRSSITWRAQYWTSTDGMGFNVEDHQQYTALDVPGMTNAIAVTSYGKTTIHMRKVLDEPLEYIPVFRTIDLERHADEEPWLLDEIYYEITATGISPETVLTWIPIN